MKQAVQPSKMSQPEGDNLSSRSDNNLANCVGRKIRNIRKRNGLTVIELTELTGLSSGSLSKIKYGIISPSLNTLKRQATALDVSVPALFTKDENRNTATFVPADMLGGLTFATIR